MMFYRYYLLLFFVVFTGCASTPEFDTSQVDASLTPQSVITEPEVSHGKVALWGGTILDTTNLKDKTHIEMLAYPLDGSNRPKLESKPLGRFIIEHPGFLEPTTYAQGRQLTVLGTISGIESGQVGETSYSYPLVSERQLHLWSENTGNSNRSNVHFGIGIGVGL
jgi:outer membrane lipoprotein